MCSACALSLASFGSFPALMPRLFSAWRMSTGEAALVNAGFYAGYMLVSPVVTTLTDRLDARRIVLASCALGTLAALVFAGSHGVFGVALTARALSGVATAGSFMPGLRALTDRVHVSNHPRYVGYYMGCFAIGTSLSYALCEALAERFGVTTALGCTAVGPLAAGGLVALLAPRPEFCASADRSAPPRSSSAWSASTPGRDRQLRLCLWPDPAPILRDRAALGIVCCYGLHTWELFTLRSWGVAFLSFVQGGQGFEPSFWWAPATVLAVANVLTAPASLAGVEAAQKLGRARWLELTMLASALGLAGLAGVGTWPARWACAAVLLCGALMGADSATLTSGLVSLVPAERRGLGMAVHTTVGFAGAFVGPLAFGLILDRAGGPSHPGAWVRAFLCNGLATLGLGIWVRARLLRERA
jgi:MFS family permease